MYGLWKSCRGNAFDLEQKWFVILNCLILSLVYNEKCLLNKFLQKFLISINYNENFLLCLWVMCSSSESVLEVKVICFSLPPGIRCDKTAPRPWGKRSQANNKGLLGLWWIKKFVSCRIFFAFSNTFFSPSCFSHFTLFLKRFWSASSESANTWESLWY